MVRCRSLLLSLEKVAAEDSHPRFPAAQAGSCAGCCEMVDVTSTAQPSDTPGPPEVVVPAQAVSGVLRDKSTLLQGPGMGPRRGEGVGGAARVGSFQPEVVLPVGTQVDLGLSSVNTGHHFQQSQGLRWTTSAWLPFPFHMLRSGCLRLLGMQRPRRPEREPPSDRPILYKRPMSGGSPCTGGGTQTSADLNPTSTSFSRTT